MAVKGEGKIKNKLYTNFLKANGTRKFEEDEDGFTFMLEELPRNIEHVLKRVTGIRGKYILEGQALMQLMFVTGCRPIEALLMKRGHIDVKGNDVSFSLRTAKHGKPRVISVDKTIVCVDYILEHQSHTFPDKYLFIHYQSTMDDAVRMSNKVWYHINKWTKGIIKDKPNESIPPYYFRHNRFTRMADDGASLEDIQRIKGARKADSVAFYLHQTKKNIRKASKFIK